MKIFENLIYAVVILFCSTTVTSFELFSTLGVGLSVGGAVLYAGFDKIRCPFVECCDDKWIPLNFNRLETSLRDELFGQHLTQKIVVAALRGHFREVANPKKALALSFHGYPGSGKTFVSQFIKDNIYKLGSKSKFAHFFAGRSDFAIAEKTDIYKINLMDWIRGNVTQCPMSLFVFDEVDKMPSGVLDAIKPFLDYHEEINGVDYRKRRVGKVASAERGQIVSIMCCLSPTIPPAIIFLRKRLNPELYRDAPEGTLHLISDSGCMNTELFVEWLQHFTKFVKPTKVDPALLIVDNHTSHCSLEPENTSSHFLLCPKCEAHDPAP
ncbi:torsin-1B-like isoform X3 [Periplaneta americana]|uniref:torsin-1B-like isoform X3 n=1 Tax=Periplaneta americana TaxID=6978 RepID=UPI0037E858B7